ncbi:MAG: hypothetical protein PWP24_1649, partial [Clostridiales bacterium]|nr:hypothetical protein [Clostridiales bacterium]
MESKAIRRIRSENQDYNNEENEEIILENEEEQLHTSFFSNGESVYPMKTIKVDKGFFT